MSHKEEITPEEKLLNLIRHSKKNTPKQKSSAPAAFSQENKVSDSAAASVGRKRPIPKEARIILSSIKSLNFVLINRLILLATLVTLLLLLFDLFYHSPNFPRLQLSPQTTQTKASLENNKTKPYSYYQQEIAKRQLFSPSPIQSNTKKVIPAGQTFKELIKGLKLLGIVSGEETQVIIEDAKLHKTYFLYTGDYLGEIKVEEISSNRVVLEFKGERISLFL